MGTAISIPGNESGKLPTDCCNLLIQLPGNEQSACRIRQKLMIAFIRESQFAYSCHHCKLFNQIHHYLLAIRAHTERRQCHCVLVDETSFNQTTSWDWHRGVDQLDSDRVFTVTDLPIFA